MARTGLLQDFVARHAAERPDAPAVVSGARRATYRELDEQANRLAHLLLESGCAVGDRVGLYLPKSIEAIVGMLGVLKAGCIYVPLDPTGPLLRTAKIVEACEPRALLVAHGTGDAAGSLKALCPTGSDLRIGALTEGSAEQSGPDLAFGPRDLTGRPSSPPALAAGAPDVAHILFTSGSTGTPKGVMVRHANVEAFVRWAVAHFGMVPSDRNSAHSPLVFDLSTFDVFGTFCAGATLHLVPPELNLAPRSLADFVRDSALTQWFSVPSLLNLMVKFDAVRPGDFPALQRLLWCGEVLPTGALRYLMERLPHVRFTNLYGPTETTIASSYYDVPACPADDRVAIPIGQACAGEALHVLAADMTPPTVGEIGDLYIAGAGVTAGYWRDPGKTDAAFLRRATTTGETEILYKTGDLARVDEAGLVHFCGRSDSQIKSRGYRIELGEIEAALGTIGEVRESAVVAVASAGFEGATICCAFVAAGVAPMAIPVLRKRLLERLPSYMVPARWAPMDGLPRNANGKVDRARIRSDFAGGLL